MARPRINGMKTDNRPFPKQTIFHEDSIQRHGTTFGSSPSVLKRPQLTLKMNDTREKQVLQNKAPFIIAQFYNQQNYKKLPF